MFSRRAYDPKTKEYRVDCISLDTYPARYDVVLGDTHHDARTIAEYMISGGTCHPLTRTPFTQHEYETIFAKVSKDVRKRIEDSRDLVALTTLNTDIIDTMGVWRTVNFLNILYETNQSTVVLRAFVECIRDNRDLFDFLSNSPVSMALSSALIKSLPAVDDDVMNVLQSSDVDKKRRFLDSIAIPDFELEYFTSCMGLSDIFLLIQVVSLYNLETQFMC
jgi:hypothetical protein